MNRKAFTLIELLIVILIMAILTTLAWPQYVKFMEKSIASEAVQAMGVLRSNILVSAAYDSDPVADVPQLKHWSFGGVTMTADYPPSAARVIYIRRDGPYSGTYIQLNINLISGTATWYGTHPGVPQG